MSYKEIPIYPGKKPEQDFKKFDPTEQTAAEGTGEEAEVREKMDNADSDGQPKPENPLEPGE
jgi:hypothetical protein